MAEKKLQIAIYWGGACGGCDVSILDTNQFILDVDALCDVRLWPIAADGKYKDIEAMEDGELDVTLMNGACVTPRTSTSPRCCARRARSSSPTARAPTWAAYRGSPTSCLAKRSSRRSSSTTRRSSPATALSRCRRASPTATTLSSPSSTTASTPSTRSSTSTTTCRAVRRSRTSARRRSWRSSAPSPAQAGATQGRRRRGLRARPLRRLPAHEVARRRSPASTGPGRSSRTRMSA